MSSLDTILSKVKSVEAQKTILSILVEQPKPTKECVGPPSTDVSRNMKNLEARIPKAANATDTTMRYLKPDDVSVRYRVQ